MRSSLKMANSIFSVSVATLFIFLLVGEPQADAAEFGPAGSLVQSFFKNWESRRFAEMRAQTINSRDERLFVKYMRETPIRWQNLSILGEKYSDDHWEVKLSMEVTDVKSAFTACLINLKYPYDVSKPRVFYLHPDLLKIQEFMPVKQTWKIFKQNEKYFIDVCAGKSKGKRHENIMNYVLDASDLSLVPPDAPRDVLSPEEALKLTAYYWLAEAKSNLGYSMKEMKSIMIKSKPLISKAEFEFQKLVISSKKK